jgi:hypothetical protein
VYKTNLDINHGKIIKLLKLFSKYIKININDNIYNYNKIDMNKYQLMQSMICLSKDLPLLVQSGFWP